MPQYRFYNLEHDGQAVIARIELTLDDDATAISCAELSTPKQKCTELSQRCVRMFDGLTHKRERLTVAVTDANALWGVINGPRRRVAARLHVGRSAIGFVCGIGLSQQ